MRILPSTVAFITGGSSGISKAFAQRMHKRGAMVAVADVCKKSMDQLKEELGEDRLLTTECDVRDVD